MKVLDRLVYTPTEVAEVASVSRPTIYRWMHMEGFPVARIGGCTRIPADAFKRWLDKQAGVLE
ncbi:MAG: DNA-binding protein [Oscillibacter sp.]|nr:DNA-binding protein [Oscillibacter sp.]